jgi:uncharacterized sulfatase
MHYGAWLADQGVNLKDYFGIHRYDHYGRWSLPQEFHGSRWVADEAIAAMDMASRQGKPFCLWASFQDPHNPYVTPEPWDSMYRREQMPVAPRFEGEMQGKPPFYQSLMAGQFYGKDDPDLQFRGGGDCKIRPELRDGDTRQLWAAYYGMVSLMDFHIGRILAELERRGLMGNTLIVFTTDHGDYLGSHGLWGKGLPTYEEMQRIPFIVRHPGCATPGRRSAAIQSLVDIEATCLAVTGLPQPPLSQGINQDAAWRGANVRVRDWAMVEFRPAQTPFMQRTFITDRHKLVLYRQRSYGERYDLQEDPNQLTNLFDAPSARTLREELILQLAFAEMDKDGVPQTRTAFA